MNVPRIDLTQKQPLFGWDWYGKRVDMRCPNGHIASLDDHEIKEDGTVRPSVSCPKCSFHEQVRLMNYEEEPTKIVQCHGLTFHVPLWAGFVAMDTDGSWCAYEKQPEPHYSVWLPPKDTTRCKKIAKIDLRKRPDTVPWKASMTILPKEN